MTATPRTIVMVLPNDGNGGMQAQVRLVADALRRRGHGVTLAVGGLRTPSDDELALPPFSLATLPRFVAALRRTARDLHADVVHGHGLRTGLAVGLLRGPQRVVTCHGLDPERVPRGLLRVLRRLPVTVVSCGAGPQRLLAAQGLPSRVLNNAVGATPRERSRKELEEYFELPSNAVVALWPARFSTQKGHDRLLELVREVNDDRLVVVCCGDGPLAYDVAREVVREGRDGQFRLRPFEPDAASWLAATDLFLLPSRWEGQPLVLLEALRAGLPVLSLTAVGDEGLVVEGRNGRHAPNPAAAAPTLQQWINDPSSRPFDPTFNASLLKSHELDVVVDAYERLYAEP